MKKQKFRELLIDLSTELGDDILKEVLKRFFYQLGKNDVEIPENPVNLDLSNFSDEDLRNLVLLLAEELEVFNGLGFEEKFLKKLESKFKNLNFSQK